MITTSDRPEHQCWTARYSVSEMHAFLTDDEILGAVQMYKVERSVKQSERNHSQKGIVE